MKLNEVIFGKYKADLFECIQIKLQSIEDEHGELLAKLEIDFKKTTSLAWNDNIINFVFDPANPMDKLPAVIKSKVDKVISSCIQENS